MKPTNRRLRGFLRGCGDPDCLCAEPVILEAWIEDGVERSEEFWVGNWCGDATSRFAEEELLNELAAACSRHRMVQDSFDPREWEREL